jgi:hypothetical protein
MIWLVSSAAAAASDLSPAAGACVESRLMDVPG